MELRREEWAYLEEALEFKDKEECGSGGLSKEERALLDKITDYLDSFNKEGEHL